MRTLDFKKYFYANLSATILSAVVGITMAYKGFGVWALVFQNLVKSIGGVFVLFTLVRWFPKLKFSWTRLKGLFSFGLNLTAANLIGSIFNELRGFLIGLNFQPADLAYFNRGNSIPGIINDNINGTISGVLFPAMSRLQEDKAAVKNALRRSMMTSVYIMAPLMVLLAVTSKQLILLLYTDKWIQAVPFMQVAVFYHLFSILGLANLQALNAIGRSDITIKLEFIKKPILMVILLFTCKISPLALSVGTAIYAIIGAAINAQPNKKQISYSYKEQLADTLPQITIALAASSVAYAIGLFHLNLYIQLFLQYVIGIGAYLFLTKLLRLESMNYTFTTIRDYFSSLQS